MLITTTIDLILYQYLPVYRGALFWVRYCSLFIYYDLPMVSDVFNMLMYAADTTLYCNINQNISEIEINHELWKVSQWLAANKLSLNVGKTKFMVFRMRNNVVSYPDLQINGNAIERVTQFIFLGLILHESLSWDKHINHISLKVSKAIGILYRLKSIYPHRVVLTLYNTLIPPHFNYCILSWRSTLRKIIVCIYYRKRQYQ